MKLALLVATMAMTNLLAAPPAKKGQKSAKIEKETSSRASADAQADVGAAEVDAPPVPDAEPAAEPEDESPPMPGEHRRVDRPGDMEPGEDQVLIGQSNFIEEDEWVNGDAVVVGGDLTVNGQVDGDAVCVGGTLVVGPHAVIEGDAVNVGGRAEIAETATIRGEKVNVGVALGPLHHLSKLHVDAHHGHEGEPGFMKRLMSLIWEIVLFAFFMFIALLLTVFMPRQFNRIEEHLTGSFPRSALMGAAVMIIVPIVMLILLVTLVGIPLIPLVLMAVSVTMIVGYVVFSRVLGRRLVGDRHVMMQIFAGMLLLSAAAILGDVLALPGGVMETVAHVFRFIGGIIFVGASFAGLGAVLYSHWGKRTLAQTEALRTNGNGNHPPPASPPASDPGPHQ